MLRIFLEFVAICSHQVDFIWTSICIHFYVVFFLYLYPMKKMLISVWYAPIEKSLLFNKTYLESFVLVFIIDLLFFFSFGIMLGIWKEIISVSHFDFHLVK